jgi:predicted DCC family thiol-disulfide oxidoreductase YuxK
VYTRFDAVLQTSRYLGGVSRLLEVARILPSPVRDLGYRLMARHRHRLGSHGERCFVPSETEQERFLE